MKIQWNYMSLNPSNSTVNLNSRKLGERWIRIRRSIIPESFWIWWNQKSRSNHADNWTAYTLPDNPPPINPTKISLFSLIPEKKKKDQLPETEFRTDQRIEDLLEFDQFWFPAKYWEFLDGSMISELKNSTGIDFNLKLTTPDIRSTELGNITILNLNNTHLLIQLWSETNFQNILLNILKNLYDCWRQPLLV
jgi:hypothetical protein